MKSKIRIRCWKNRWWGRLNSLRSKYKPTKEQIRIIEFNEDLLQFIQNLIAPLRVVKIEELNGVVTIVGPDIKTKGLMIGSKAKNLRETEEIVKKHFPDLEEIKVV